jgi:hypothetical protein
MQTHNSSCLAGPNSQFRAWRQKDCLARPARFSPFAETAPEEETTFRADLVARVRRQIADGTYGTEAQLEIAVDRMLRYLDEAG